jgi:hypothetical protein
MERSSAISAGYDLRNADSDKCLNLYQQAKRLTSHIFRSYCFKPIRYVNLFMNMLYEHPIA